MLSDENTIARQGVVFFCARVGLNHEDQDHERSNIYDERIEQPRNAA